jgi:hypothetical protein
MLSRSSQAAGRFVSAIRRATALAVMLAIAAETTAIASVGPKEAAGDDGQAHVAVFEVGKDAVRHTLAIVAARSGKAVVYQDKDARRSEIR